MALTRKKEQTLIGLLGECIPGKMSAKLFYEFCRLLPMIAIELVTLRLNKGILEVFLTQRPADDPHFPGEWHSPGTILRVTDFKGIPVFVEGAPNQKEFPLMEQFSSALERVARNELETEVDARHLFILPAPIMQPSPRGPHLHVIFLNFLHDQDPMPTSAGQFFPVQNLPQPLMVAHQEVIRAAISFWQQHPLLEGFAKLEKRMEQEVHRLLLLH